MLIANCLGGDQSCVGVYWDDRSSKPIFDRLTWFDADCSEGTSSAPKLDKRRVGHMVYFL